MFTATRKHERFLNMRTPVKLRKQIKKEECMSSFIPYGAHVTRHTVSTLSGDYVQVVKIAGASFESADADEINTWHQKLNYFYKNIGSTNVAIWQHIIRREENTYPEGDYENDFARSLNETYKKRITTETLMVNELYISILYRPMPTKAGKSIARIFSKTDSKALENDRLEALDKIEKIVEELLISLQRYEPERLGIYTHNDIKYSQVLEFFAYLINAEWQRMPLTQTVISRALATTRPFFGHETIELRTPIDTILSAVLGIKEYVPETSPGFLNQLLTMPFCYVISQSFTFLSLENAKGILKLQRRRMEAAEDDAVSQIDEVENALDDLMSKRFVMGAHHFNMLIFASELRELKENIALSRGALSDSGIVMAREDLALEAAYWAQLPGNFDYRPRVAPITSRNFAAFAPLHNFPTGRRSGNHWGEALTMFETAAGTPFYFSYHASDPNDAEGGTLKDVGHTLILGPTGSGKTVIVTFTLCMLQKCGATAVLFTKDRDTEICIRALGGKYLPIENGVNTGFNPFQLPPTPTNIQFLNDFVKKLITTDLNLTPTEENEVARSIRGVLSLPIEARRIGRLMDFTDITQRDGIHTRLKKWCYSREAGDPDGSNAWVFDNETDTVLSVFNENKLLGFDVTDFLDNDEIRTPINMYLFHLTKALIDGRRFALFIAEFWKALSDDYFAGFAKDYLKTMRKKNAFVVLDSQSPSDALYHPISRTLIEQTATKILLPNPAADQKEYIEGLNLSEREFELLKHELEPGSRKFVIKQGHNSVIAKLDLKGLNFELDVLSSRTENIKLLESIIDEVGDDPKNWMPVFKQKRGYV